MEGKAVQVVVRLRPLNDRESKGSTLPVVTASTDKSEVCICRGQGNRQLKQAFNFDRVFTSFTSQQEVFQQTFLEQGIIDDVLRGYESTVFAYGQTGTGKTFTMEGELESPEMQGVIPRATTEIFARLSRCEWSEVKASYLEIYCEELCDLLLPHDHGDGAKLAIMEDKTKRGKGVFCHGLSEATVANEREVLELIHRAGERRKVGETKMNARSSRSHCIFTLSVHSKTRLDDGAMIESSGKLHLVDLAGSECAKACGASTEARERERKNINQSLLTLGRVIGALREGGASAGQHVPYRDSKLTRLLQESLGGRCKTCIIATLSPSALAVDESTSTLQYAQMAMGIQNKPVAMSYLKMAGIDGVGAAGSAGTGSGGGSIEEWSRMEMRLAYMESQVAEAQSALARKHAALAGAEKRADDAEGRERATAAELAQVRTALVDAVARAERGEAERDEALAEAERRAAVLAATRQTEAKLTGEARALLGALKSSGRECETLEGMLRSHAQDEQQRRLDSNAFARETAAALEKLGGASEAHASALGERARAATAALRAQLDEASATVREAAESVARATEDARTRATAASAHVSTNADGASEERGAVSAAAEGARDALLGALRARLDAARSAVSEVEVSLQARANDVRAREEERARAMAEAGGALEKLLCAHAEADADAAAKIADEVSALRLRLCTHRDDLTRHGQGLSELAEAHDRCLHAMQANRAARARNEAARAAAINAHGSALDAALEAHAGARADKAMSAALGASECALAHGDSVLGSALEGACADLEAAARRATEGCAEAAACEALQRASEAATTTAAKAREALGAQAAALGGARDALSSWLADAPQREQAAMDALLAGVQQLALRELSMLRAATADAVSKVQAEVRAAELEIGGAADELGAAASARRDDATSLEATLQQWGGSSREAADAMSQGANAVAKARAGAAEARASVQASHADARTALAAWSAASDVVAEAVREAGAELASSAASLAAAHATADGAEGTAVADGQGLRAELGRAAAHACTDHVAAASGADVATAALGARAAGAADASRDATAEIVAAAREAAAKASEAGIQLVASGEAPLAAARALCAGAHEQMSEAAAEAATEVEGMAAARARADEAEAARWSALAAASSAAATELGTQLGEAASATATALSAAESTITAAQASGNAALDDCAAAATEHASSEAVSLRALDASLETHVRTVWRAGEPVPPAPTAEPVIYSEALSATPPESEIVGAAHARDTGPVQDAAGASPGGEQPPALSKTHSAASVLAAPRMLYAQARCSGWFV